MPELVNQSHKELFDVARNLAHVAMQPQQGARYGNELAARTRCKIPPAFHSSQRQQPWGNIICEGHIDPWSRLSRASREESSICQPYVGTGHVIPDFRSGTHLAYNPRETIARREQGRPLIGNEETNCLICQRVKVEFCRYWIVRRGAAVVVNVIVIR